MTDHGLNDEKEYFCRTVEDFAHNLVAPVNEYNDASATFPYEIVR